MSRWVRFVGCYVKQKELGGLLFSPFILSTNLVFFLWSEVILDVESPTDLFWRLALDHVCDSLAPNIEKRLNIKVVGSLPLC
jgi:hypothetical protein